MLLLVLLLVLVLVLVEMVVPKPTPAKSTTGKSAPKPIRAASPTPYIRTTLVVPMPVVGTAAARPPIVGLPLYLAIPFPFTLSRKALLA